VIDWAGFREAIARGLPNADRLRMLHKMEGWLDLAPADAAAALETELKTSDARTLYQNLIILNLTLQREAASDPGNRIAARLGELYQFAGILVQKDPTVTQGPSAGELAKSELQQSATAIFARLQPVAKQIAPGLVTQATIDALEAALREAKALIQTAAADNGGLPYLFYMTASTTRMLARAYAIMGRNADALAGYEAAAAYFEKAGEPEQAEDSSNRAAELRRQLAGDLDAAAAQPLQQLNAAKSGDAWERIRAAMQLSSIAGSSGDTFEALQNAESAAKQLVGLGYPDPGVCGVEDAMGSWIKTAVASRQGVPLLGRLSEVSTLYDAILGARFAVTVAKNAAAADALNALQTELQKLSARMREETAHAQQESARDFARYFPPPPGPPPPGTEPEPTASSGEPFETLMDRMRAVDSALAKIRETCNQRAAAKEPMDDLLDEVGKLEAESDTLNSPEYAAKTRLERAYILLRLGRASEVGAVARDARNRLLAGRAASLSSFPRADQRYLYLDSLKREVMAAIMTGDFEAALALASETIRDFERERYRVTSDYRQAALLSYVADFYTWAAFSAFKLERWDNMLEAIDLIKARSAVRGSLVPDTPLADSDLLREFDEVDQALERDPANETLQNRRRQLWDLLSIARGNGGEGGEIPALRVSAIQNALAEDEGLIGYFWLANSVILAIAADRHTFHAERIVLKPEELQFLNEFVSFIETLKSSHNMDRATARLGAILIPGFLREFMKSKRRIVFSPHHSLHLIPFHAARWETGYVGTEFAVRYVPNFASVLLPWTRRVENRVLAIGIRDFADPAVQPLENVEEDAARVAEFYRLSGAAVDMLLGKDASRERIKALGTAHGNGGKVGTYRSIHFGTHGLSVFETPTQPLESRLLVQDGALDAMDIATLGLRAELVMLSACHSGQRIIDLRNLGVTPGDDIFGLQAAFFKSGVQSIVGTLWLVETKSSSPITRAFHKHYAAGEPAEIALQHAIQEYLAQAPPERKGAYYWAPYFISSIGKPPAGKETTWQN
jgi:CHAT domain-containing protein